MAAQNEFWVVIPAAGQGSRAEQPVAKQYLDIQGKPLLSHTLGQLDRAALIGGMIVCIDRQDSGWSEIDVCMHKTPVHTVLGGDTRTQSVLNGLSWLKSNAGLDDSDFVLVHDAARPCISPADIELLIQSCRGHACGGLLGLPVADTLKSVSCTGEVETTVERDSLWRALTPQMFRLGLLYTAIEQALKNKLKITDEASAMETMGWKPKMIKGRATNIKLTYPEDIALIDLFLREKNF